MYTLPETNIAPENGWLDPFEKAYVQGRTVSCRESKTIQNKTFGLILKIAKPRTKKNGSLVEVRALYSLYHVPNHGESNISLSEWVGLL